MHVTDPVQVLKVQSLKLNPVLQVAVPVLAEAVRALVLNHHLDLGVVPVRTVQILEVKVHKLKQLHGRGCKVKVLQMTIQLYYYVVYL